MLLQFIWGWIVQSLQRVMRVNFLNRAAVMQVKNVELPQWQFF